MSISRRQVLKSAGAAAAAIGLPHAFAQEPFPGTRPIRMLVPYPPGGVTDITARALTKELAAFWGVPVVIENKPGASGAIAGDMLARAAGDGHTLLMADDGVLVSAPLLKTKMPYDPATDHVAVGTACAFPNLLMAGPSAKFNTLKDFIAAAKANPGAIDYATNGVGGPHHLIWERFQERAGIKLNHIPYSGTPQALQDMAGGRVPVAISAVASATPFIQDGKARILAATTLERLPLWPNVPTLAEQGYAGFEAVSWIGVMAPGTTPPALVERLNADLRTVATGAAFRAAIAERSNLPLNLTARQTAERMQRERAETQALLKRLGVQPG
jgi:tripartite-type tricarboxylate transporter receptor subunit TctC